MKKDFTSKSWFNKKVAQIAPLLSYNNKVDFDRWRIDVRNKIEELLGDMPSIENFEVDITDDKMHENFRELSFTITTEDDAFPCKLIIPIHASKENPVPLIICLQGHETGMHASLGLIENKTDEKMLQDNMDFAIQAVEHGFAAFLMELRFMGERRFEKKEEKNVISCYRPTMGAILMGSTTIGLRVADIRTAISALPQFVDTGIKIDKLICMGHSGGGTATFFAACLDERIDAVVISCALCDFQYSILYTEHCSCNYIPGMLKYFNMSDMAGAIYPRPILSLSGVEDEIFPIEGVEKTLYKIDKMYSDQGVKNRCTLIKGNGGHMFFKEQAWPEIKRIYESI